MRALDQRLLRRARAARFLLAADVLLGVVAAGLLLVQATLIARIVTRAFEGASLGAVSTELALLALAFAMRGLVAWGFEATGRRAASSVLSELRLALVERRLRGQPAALDGVEGGELTAAAVQGVDGLEAYFGRYLPQVVLAVIVPVAVLGWVGAIDLESALLMLLTLPLVPIFMWLIGRYTEERTREHWLALRLLSTHFLDVVRGLATLRAFNRSRAQATTIDRVGERYRRAAMGTLRLSFLSGSVLELAATLGVALVAVTVGVRLVGGGLGLEAGLTILLLAPELYAPLRQLAAQFHASADGLAVAERMLELLDAPPAVGGGGRLVPPSPAEWPVRFERISFSYPSRAQRVLDRLDLELQPGETVALVGASGTGKSTVASLLLRFAEPDAGRITVGGLDLAECRTELWRSMVAWVPQRPTMFRGTVAENIGLGVRGASQQRIRDAAMLAGADRFVRALPFGYETAIGDGGRPLSAGERRRIALARAFLRDAPLVILDEPTADLDRTSADVVAEAVERLRVERTVLVIAHRPELVQRADRVVSLDVGGTAAVRNEAA
ncbi:MAG TPA: thiol reductant ABC exporter subunit CydD [Gaiellaceae bacterium]|jgi:ATP-binding cassette, subfamily C, bacterial CydD|nr:thiol reductant ABC exporter subunit CydD [Gaiellaceae bacterium]